MQIGTTHMLADMFDDVKLPCVPQRKGQTEWSFHGSMACLSSHPGRMFVAVISRKTRYWVKADAPPPAHPPPGPC